MRLLALSTLLLALLTAPGASAVDVWDKLGMDRPYEVGDADGDGYVEVHVAAVTPPCAGLYPVVGGGADAYVAGQHVYAVGATAVCQQGVWADVDPEDPDPAATGVTPVVILWLP